MNKERDNTLESLREARGKASAAFIYFVEAREYHNSHYFCFYEGADGKYYDQRIRERLGSDFIRIKAGNKKNVIRTMQLIKEKKEYDNVIVMFFVDRDMDFDMEEYKEKDLYVTPCYSIENLYSNIECFKRVIETELGLNFIDDDYNYYVKRFAELFEQFCDCILEFNALVFLRKKHSCNVDLKNYPTNNLINVDLEYGISYGREYSNLINKLKEKIGASDEEILEAKKYLISYGNPSEVYRGKNQFDFFLKYLEIVVRLVRQNKKLTSVKIEPNQNPLGSLGCYACTPNSLIDFLTKHKNKALVRKHIKSK